MTFGEKLRTLRIKKNMTQHELARAAGVGLNTISNYESGKTYPKNREIYSVLAELLEVSATDLASENDEFIISAGEKYGYSGRKQAEKLVSELGGLFAGGELSDEDKDGVMRALQDMYWETKEINKKKYTPKKYRKSSDD